MKTEKSDNELIEAFWISQGGKMHMLADVHYYESDWNMLMPVVEKIQDVEIVKNRVIRTCAEVTIYYKACKIEYFPDEDSGDEHDQFECQTQGKTKLEAVYKAVLKFIKWLNETIERETKR